LVKGPTLGFFQKPWLTPGRKEVPWVKGPFGFSTQGCWERKRVKRGRLLNFPGLYWEKGFTRGLV